MKKKIFISVLAEAILISSTVVAFADGAQCEEAVGAVYTMTNDSAGNQVVVFSRDGNGILTKVVTIPTGGKGSGSALDPVGSQGSLMLSC